MQLALMIACPALSADLSVYACSGSQERKKQILNLYLLCSAIVE